MVKSCIHTYSTVARTTSKYAIFVPLWPSSTEFRKIPRKQKFRGNEQIPRLGSKFRVPQKTVVPRYQYKQLFTGACYIDVTDTSLVSIRSHSLDHSGDFSTQCHTLPSCLAFSRSLGGDWGLETSSWSSSCSLDRPTPQQHWICSCQPWWSDTTARAGYAMTMTTMTCHCCVNDNKQWFLMKHMKFWLKFCVKKRVMEQKLLAEFLNKNWFIAHAFLTSVTSRHVWLKSDQKIIDWAIKQLVAPRVRSCVQQGGGHLDD